jgi:hypothetical protein
VKRFLDIAGVPIFAVVIICALLFVTYWDHVTPVYTFEAGTSPVSAGTVQKNSQSSSIRGNAIIPEEVPCDEEGGTYAVIRKLNPVLYLNPSENHSLNEVKANDLRIACIREWANSIKDPCVRSKYIQILDSYARDDQKIADAISQHRPVEDSFEVIHQKMERQIKTFEAAHEVPKPPKCEADLIRKVRP